MRRHDVKWVLIALCFASSCFVQLASCARREAKIRSNIGHSDSPLPYTYVDNLSPGFSDAFCQNHQDTIRGPYLQAGGDTRTIVRWSSSASGIGIVCYGTSPGNMSSIALDSEMFEQQGSAHHHSVTIKDLKPDTKYFYVTALVSEEILSSGGVAEVSSAHSDSHEQQQWQEEKEMMDFLFPEEQPADPTRAFSIVAPAMYYSFTTFPAPRSQPQEPIRVWAIGDSGNGDYKAVSVRDAFVNFTGGDWDLTLGLGDLAYSDGRDWEYQKGFFDLLAEQNARVPVFTTPGNHDRPSSDLWKQTGVYFDIFSNPGDGRSGLGVPSNHKSYYSFDYGPIHFVSVDSDQLGLEDDPALYEWLEKDLKEAQKANYTWIVAYHHQPPYSKGSHDSDHEYECYKLRSNLVPMFEKYGVDLVLAGHSHSYERSHLLNGHFGSSHEAATNPAVVLSRWQKDSEGVDTVFKRGCGPNSGTVYIVTGSGTKTSGGSLNHPAMHNSQNELGSVLLEFNPNKSLGIYLVGSELGPERQVLDHAILYKDAWKSCMDNGEEEMTMGRTTGTQQNSRFARAFSWEEEYAIGIGNPNPNE